MLYAFCLQIVAIKVSFIIFRVETYFTPAKLISNLEAIKIDGQTIECVPEYKYLGQTLAFVNKSEKELKIRRANAWKAFWALRSVFKSNMKLKSKIRILNSAVTPVLTYGVQTWATTNK